MNTEWTKSSRSSDAAQGNCVEVRLSDNRPQVRDSKLGDGSPIIGLTSIDFEGLKSIARGV